MATTARPRPWVYVTWISGLISGDTQCWFAPWVQSHFKIQKIDNNFDLAAWSIEHADMVQARRRALEADGWTVYVEGQNDFKLHGQAATLSGRCDLVAVRGDEALVEDYKTGQQRNSDFAQILEYMLALPLFHPAVKDKRLAGAVVYRTGRREIQPEEFTPALRQRILDTITRMGDPVPPATSPSARECAWCRVNSADCPDRIETPQGEVAVQGLF